MPLLVLIIVKWILSKSVALAAMAALAVAIFAFWMFAKNSFGSEEKRTSELQALEAQSALVYADLEAARSRLVELGGEIEAAQRRAASAAQTIEYLSGLMRRIERWLTLSAPERAAVERDLEQARTARENDEQLIGQLVGEQSRLRLDRVALAEQAKDLAVRIQSLDVQPSAFTQYLLGSWQTLKPYLLGAIAAAVLLPLLWKLFAFYVWAPLLAMGGSLRLVKEALPLPKLVERGVSIQLEIAAGQRAWVKESYLQASDENLKRRTRFVLNWQIPATCIAAGLVEMIELAGVAEEGRVTVSPQRQAELEIALIEVPEGGQLIVRPSCIAGAVSRSGATLAIKRRWRLFHPQAWMTFQFRYFIFHGPCALIVAGVRGVRYEALETHSEKGRRTNQVATIGFTPDLSYGVARAETFWSYFRGFNPLFDDVFRGRGGFLCQEISERDVNPAVRFWSGLWQGALRLLGV